MDLDPAGLPAKRARAKTKTPAGTEAAASRTRKSSRKTNDAAELSPEVTVTAVTADPTAADTDAVVSMIATAAYYLAEQRNFEPGHELDDWLTAERQIRSLYS